MAAAAAAAAAPGGKMTILPLEAAAIRLPFPAMAKLNGTGT